jgi:hypothetical protein
MPVTTENIISGIRKWSMNQIDECKDINPSNAIAIYDEFREWIDPQGEELNVMCLEPES